jgi:hypothetical protein
MSTRKKQWMLLFFGFLFGIFQALLFIEEFYKVVGFLEVMGSLLTRTDKYRRIY